MKRNFRDAKIMVWSLFTGFVLGAVPQVFDYAQSQRPLGGIGSEVLFPFLPFILLPVFNKICDFIWERMVEKWQQKRTMKIM